MGKTIDQTDGQLRPEFHRLTGFAADDRADMRLGQADDAPLNLMPALGIHLVLLAVNLLDNPKLPQGFIGNGLKVGR